MITTTEEYNAATVGEQQDAVSSFVGRYVQNCQTTLIEYVLKQSVEDEDAPLQHDEITNMTATGSITINGVWVTLTEERRDELQEHYEYLQGKAQGIYDSFESSDMAGEWTNAHTLAKLEAKLEARCDRMDLFEKTTVYRLDGIVSDLQGMDFDDFPEVYEWWACDRWFIARLEEQGECTLDGEYWGRCTTGQSISIDEVVIQIYKDLLTKHS